MAMLVAIVTHVRRITYMPGLKLTLYYCVSWCTHIYIYYIYIVTVLRVSGNRSWHRKTRSTDNIHTKSDVNIMLLCATWYANKVNVR